MAEFEFLHKSAAGVDLLYIDGPLVEVEITAPIALVGYLRDNQLPPFPSARGYAVIDTGASLSVVEESVMKQLELPSVDTQWTATIHGNAEMRSYNASANFPGLDLFSVPILRVPGGFVRTMTASGDDVIMLLGRDLLRHFTFTYDGPNSRIKIRT